MSNTLKLVILGRPVPKKNSAILIKGQARILPSATFTKYENAALPQIAKAMPGQFREPVSVKCRYWFATKQWWPDLVGLLQGTSDILQKAGVLKDDRLIANYNDSRIVGLDEFNPRAEIEIFGLGLDYDTPDTFVERLRAQSLF